jgi:hypothetical protein
MDLDRLNPGIRHTVEWLQSIGYRTCDSGDGVTHDHECDRDHAYVVMLVSVDELAHETRRLVESLRARGIEVGPIGETIDRPCIQASWDPAHGDAVATIDLMGVDDALLGWPPTVAT